MSLKQKTVHGLFWSFVDAMASQGIQFLVGIILARILTPREFGLVGMLAIFIAISQSFIDSGFSNALIRKMDCSQNDYSTIFYFNISVAFLCYAILFLTSSAIASFYKEPQLKLLTQVLGLSLVLNSFSVIQRAILTKEINFKLQARVSIIASLGSGGAAIWAAVVGLGVWSLVILTVCRAFLYSFFLWIWGRWQPALIFSRDSFKELFSFGSKLLASGLIDTIFRNIYYLIIGKYFTAVELGYYARADQFQSLPSQNLNMIISRVSFPVLAGMQNDVPKLKATYQRIIKSTMLATFVLMLGLAAVARPLILVLIGRKWLPAVVYLQLLCLVGMFYPLHALNLNMLQVQGRSDLFLRLEIIKKTLAVPTIIIGVIFGIKALILGTLAMTLFAYYLNSYWSGKFIGYPMIEQVKDIFPSFLLALSVSIAVFLAGNILRIPDLLKLIIQFLLGATLIVGIARIFKMENYLYIKDTAIEKLKEIRGAA